MRMMAGEVRRLTQSARGELSAFDAVLRAAMRIEC
jgi:hypothetical protein